MTDNELFGNSEQLDDTISRRETVKAIRDAMLAWSYMPMWREDKIVDAVKALPSAQPTAHPTDRETHAFSDGFAAGYKRGYERGKEDG